MVRKNRESNSEALTSENVYDSTKINLNFLKDELNVEKKFRVEYGKGAGKSGTPRNKESLKGPKNNKNKEMLPSDVDKYMQKWMNNFDQAVKMELGEIPYRPQTQEFRWGSDLRNSVEGWVDEHYEMAINFVRDQSYKLLGISKDINKNNTFQNIMKGFIDTLLQSPGDLIGLFVKNPVEIISKIQNVYSWLQTGIDTITKNYDITKPKGQYNVGCWSYSVLMTVFG